MSGIFRKKLFLLTGGVIFFALVIWFFLKPVFAGERMVPADIRLGPVSIRLYSLTLAAAVACGYWLASRRRLRYGLSENDLDTLVVVCVLAGLVGARLHHVLTAWDFYSSRPELIFQIWRGGLGIYGGVAGGALAAFVYARRRSIPFLKIADLLAPSVILGQAIGRWGNFFNQELYGFPTSLPWKLFIDEQHRFVQFADQSFFHPLFLYESLWNIIVLLVLLRLAKIAQGSAGMVFGWYLILYSFGRFSIESLRIEPTIIYGYPLNQLLALVAVAGGAGLVLWVKSVKPESLSGR